MYGKLEREEVLQVLDRLIERREAMLHSAEEELQKERTALLTLTIREHVMGLGSLSKEEERAREVALSSFRDFLNRVDSEAERLKKLRAAR